MHIRTALKWVFRFFVLSLGLIITAFVITGFSVEDVIALTKENLQETSRLNSQSAEEKLNIWAENLVIESVASDSLFRVNEKLKVTCVISGSSGDKSYEVVLKTDKEEIVRKTVGGPKKTEEVTGVYIPKESGLHPVACRVDFENKIEESDERDNRLVKYAMIF